MESGQRDNRGGLVLGEHRRKILNGKPGVSEVDLGEGLSVRDEGLSSEDGGSDTRGQAGGTRRLMLPSCKKGVGADEANGTSQVFSVRW